MKDGAEQTCLQVGGFIPLTGIDFPDRLAAVVFCQGCPWRCSYCHNPHLIPRSAQGDCDWPTLLDFLKRRRGLLDAVVFSGGEPTLQAALPVAVRQVRALGFQVGLHTSGCYPQRLQSLLPLLDWVGLDIKAPAQHYEQITGVSGSAAKVARSLQLLLDSGVAHECRTTWHPGLFSREALQALGQSLKRQGVMQWRVQACQLV